MEQEKTRLQEVWMKEMCKNTAYWTTTEDYDKSVTVMDAEVRTAGATFDGYKKKNSENIKSMGRTEAPAPEPPAPELPTIAQVG